MPRAINIEQTERGLIAIENQTRYDTDDLLTIVNWLESQVVNERVRRPRGSVIQLVNWRHKNFFVTRREWVEGNYVEERYPNWVDLKQTHAWNVVKIVPPDRLHLENPLEALSWDGKEAPRKLVELLVERLRRELGISRKLNRPGDIPSFRLRINEEPGSRVRGADRRVERMSIGLSSLEESRRWVRRSTSRLHKARGYMNDAIEDISRVDPAYAEEARDLRNMIQQRIEDIAYLVDRMFDHREKSATKDYTQPPKDLT